MIIDSIGLIDSVVLSDPWPNNVLSYIPELHGDYNDTIQKEYSGKTYYISINLRRPKYAFPSDTSHSDSVLKIRVPYVYVDKDEDNKKIYPTTYARFDSVPDPSYNSYYQLSNLYDSSKIRNLVGVDTNNRPTEFIITRSMLPTDTDDITISGFMIFDNSKINNHKLSPHVDMPSTASEGEIDSLKIEVTYLSNSPVAIDWIKFETPNARRIFQGVYDSLIVQGIQQNLDQFANEPYTSAGNKPYRFIFNVEGSPANWGAERHFRKIVGDIVSGQNAPYLPYHYQHYINPADRWVSLYKFTPMVAAPFSASNKQEEYIDTIKKITYPNSWKTFGYYQGYTRYKDGTLMNIFNSEYDTFLGSKKSVEKMRGADIDVYLSPGNVGYYQGHTSPMVYWEYFQYKRLVEGLHNGYIFTDKPWYPQGFLQSDFKNEKIYVNSDSIETTKIINSQASNCNITGEQYKLMMWNAVILGAKGLMYDGGMDYDEEVRIIPREIDMKDKDSNYASLPDYEFLTHPLFDNDYIDSSYSHFFKKKRFTKCSKISRYSSYIYGNIAE